MAVAGAETEFELIPSEAARGAASVVGCMAAVIFSVENFLLLVLSTSPFVLEAAWLLLLFKMFRASLTFLGTEVGGCGGAEFGKEVGPELAGLFPFDP